MQAVLAEDKGQGMKPIRTIYDLCAGSGAWSQPYLDAGYNVVRIEIMDGQDVRTLETVSGVHGVLAAPPCKRFSKAGACHWPKVTPRELAEALAVVDACIRFIVAVRPQFWALENPPGRLRRWIGKPAFIFQPFEFGDPWAKQTCLWGDFVAPWHRRLVEPQFSWVKKYEVDTKDRAANRSKTPPGFARAFFEANP